MLHVIDKVNGHIIQKITKADGSLVRYQTVHENDVGNTPKVQTAGTLLQARILAGWQEKLPEFVTKPKSQYPQNQKGYRADNRRNA